MHQQQDLTALAETLVALDEQSAVSVMCSVLESRPALAPSVVTFSVPDLTYPPIKALTERRSEGTIKSFNEQKGFGFIACEELLHVFGYDVFLSKQQLSGFTVGQEVSFAVALNKENKPQAYDLRAANANGKGSWSMQSAGSQAQTPSQKWAAQENWNAQEQWGAQDKWGGQDNKWNANANNWNAQGQGAGGWQQGQTQQWNQGGGAKRKTGPDFSPSPDAIIGEHQGYIKSFNHSNGYGFITCEALQQEGYTHDVFLPAAQFTETGYQVGSEVEFTAFLNAKGNPQGFNLRDPSWGKRARKG